jgi:diguanylate cyclase (GGDEF)-like protein
MTNFLDTSMHPNRIGRRLTILIIAFSSLITLAISATQLFFDYHQQISDLDSELSQTAFFLPSISESVWSFDDQQIKLLLDALISLPYVEQVGIVTEDHRDRWSSGAASSQYVLRRVYPLMRQFNGKDQQVGTLEVTASLDAIYGRLVKHGLSILLSNGVKTFLVAFFMLAVFRRQVTQRLECLEMDVCKLATDLIPDALSLYKDDPHPSEADDEIGRLRRTFRMISEKLKYHQSQLEASVVERTSELTRLNNELRELARTDALTALANRRAFIEAIETEFHRSNRFGTPAAVLMIDVDHFKQVNDVHGHEAGDHALVAVARILKTMARATDLPARFGGEEFVVLLTNTDSSGALEMAERIRIAIAQSIVISPSGNFGLTASIGVTPLSRIEDNWSAVISRADQGMYRAKELGRNRVVAVGQDLLIH